MMSSGAQHAVTHIVVLNEYLTCIQFQLNTYKTYKLCLYPLSVPCARIHHNKPFK